MSEWTFGFDAAAAATGDTLQARIGAALVAEVRRGRLPPGSRLPGSRRLAEAFGVHRNTVLAALRALEAEGWLVARPGSGTYVAADLPDRLESAWTAGARSIAPTQPGFDFAPAPEQPVPVPPHGALVLAGGAPDLRRVPVTALTRAWRRALTVAGGTLLGYGPPEGHPALRSALADLTSRVRGLSAGPEQVIVTRGAQQALDLVARAFVRPGDVVAVEVLGYPPAWSALERAGARLLPLPVDGDGLDVEALERAVAANPVRAVYLTPHHQFPTMVPLSPGRRARLLSLAAAHRMIVIEDDYDNELHHVGRPLLPLASADRAGVVIYVGTLSKILAPGLRIGFAVAPAQVITRLAAERRVVDRQGDRALEAAVAELLEDGEVQRHARRMRRLYSARRDALVLALRAELGDALAFDVPAGGVALWARLRRDLPFDAWVAACRARGVWFQTAAELCRPEVRPPPCVRLGFASLEEEALRRAAVHMGEALPR